VVGSFSSLVWLRWGLMQRDSRKRAEMVLSRYDHAGCRPGRLWHGICSMVEHMDGYPLRNAN
jgi:hypothetical protein